MIEKWIKSLLDQKGVYIDFFQNSGGSLSNKSHFTDFSSEAIAGDNDPIKLVLALLNPVNQVQFFFKNKLKL